MAKSSLQSIYDITKFLKKEALLPIYYLCGEDTFAINAAYETIVKSFEPYVLSDFDKEIISADKGIELNNIIDMAYSFPFGGGRKIIVVKNIESIKDKKLLTEFADNPAEFTSMICLHYASLNQNEISKEPYSKLISKNFLFEAKLLKGEELVNWFVKFASKSNFELPLDYAKTVIEIVGEDKSLLEMQLQKFISYSQGRNKLTLDELIRLSSPTKQYSIFDLLDALGKGDKSRSLEIGYNLLDNGVEIIVIINMISKFILTISQALDLTRQKIPDKEAAQKADASFYFYLNCKRAVFFMSDDKLQNAAKALLNADLSVKSTSLEPKTILQILITEMLDKIIQDPFES